jgi:hypothetical protein
LFYDGACERNLETKERHQIVVILQLMNATNEEQIEVEQRIVIYTCAFKGEYLVMDYLFDMLIKFKRILCNMNITVIKF